MPTRLSAIFITFAAFSSPAVASNIIVLPGNTYDNNSGYSNYSLILNQGTFNNFNTLDNWSTVDNQGVFNNGSFRNLDNNANFYNSGLLDNQGNINNSLYFENNGTLENHEFINNSGTVVNSATVNNYNTINTIDNWYNNGAFNNQGGSLSIEGEFTNDNSLVNNGYIHLLGSSYNFGATSRLSNFGLLDNQDVIEISDGAELINHGVMNNTATVSGSGSLINHGNLLNNSWIDVGRLVNSSSLDSQNVLIAGEVSNTFSGVIDSSGVMVVNSDFLNQGAVNLTGDLDMASGFGSFSNTGMFSLNGLYADIYRSSFSNSGTFNNNNSFLQIMAENVNNSGQLDNNATINFGYNGFSGLGQIINSGQINNYGSIAVISSAFEFFNFGNLHNRQWAEFSSGELKNYGNTINDGFMYLDELENNGDFQNHVLLETNEFYNGSNGNYLNRNGGHTVARVAFVNDGYLENDSLSRIEFSSLDNNGTFVNDGEVKSTGFVVQEINNAGYIRNKGRIETGLIENSGSVENHGDLTVYEIVSSGALYNGLNGIVGSNTVEVDGALINHGTLYADLVTINHGASLRGDGYISAGTPFSTGVIIEEGATLSPEGSDLDYSMKPVDYQDMSSYMYIDSNVELNGAFDVDVEMHKGVIGVLDDYVGHDRVEIGGDLTLGLNSILNINFDMVYPALSPLDGPLDLIVANNIYGAFANNGFVYDGITYEWTIIDFGARDILQLSAVAVPVPAAAWLLSSGILMLAGFGRKRAH